MGYWILEKLSPNWNITVQPQESMDFRNWTHILFSLCISYVDEYFYTLKRGACWELSVMSQLHHLWGKESSLPLLPYSCISNSKKGSYSTDSGVEPTPRATCCGYGAEAPWPAELVSSTHSTWLAPLTQTTRGWSGGQALVTKGERCYLKKGMERCAGRDICATCTGHICSIQHINTALFPSACHDYSAWILRIIDRTKVSTWFLLCCWWSGGGSCQLGELWIGGLPQFRVRYKVRDCTK